MSGIGLISLFIGEKPDTVMPGAMTTGNGRAAIAAAAAARSAAGKASRRASAAARSSALRVAMSASGVSDGVTN